MVERVALINSEMRVVCQFRSRRAKRCGAALDTIEGIEAGERPLSTSSLSQMYLAYRTQIPTEANTGLTVVQCPKIKTFRDSIDKEGRTK